MSDALIEELRTALVEVVGKDIDGILPEDDLVERLGIDSLTGLRWLAVIEKRYGLLFPDEHLAEYRSLASVQRFIIKQRKGAGT